MKTILRRQLALHALAAAIGAAWACAPSAANAQPSSPAIDYPNKPVRLIVGGGSELPARVVAAYLSTTWKQQVNVEPLPSAGGVVAARTVKDAPADGYTLLNTTGAYLLNQAARTPPPFVMSRDFVPVALLGTAPQIVVVPSSLPVKNIAELVAYSKAHPNTVNCASAGVGGSSHLACEMLRHYTKADVQHLPFRGVGPALVDVSAGRAHVTYTAVAALGAIKEGRLRAIAVTGAKRLGALPDVPTVTEQGFPQLTLITWYGIHAPARTPAAVVDLLNRAIDKAVKDPAVMQGLVNAGLEPETMPVAAFSSFMAAQEESVTRLWRESGAKID
ncbi:tripartite tricarboxylate transporter substrate binding protein [Aquincola sp. S2]|uniref:Tripartite tricarboxylate transporter substrate binding protein n=1 Tax=Pseudaquabacterium terrae TaxID=2732868 RepID=A0ABX2EV94_9BURK|nr:tripartite tricarboxylate transporter substrate binding protein [Aquabacterium terrae]NRF72371.1 tripartite tricarboxylate transporter substrate binding protein [Aquabacterium terrae]